MTARGWCNRDNLTQRIRAQSLGILNRLHGEPWPHALPESAASVASELLDGQRFDRAEAQDPLELAATILNRADLLAEELLGDLCAQPAADTANSRNLRTVE